MYEEKNKKRLKIAPIFGSQGPIVDIWIRNLEVECCYCPRKF